VRVGAAAAGDGGGGEVAMDFDEMDWEDFMAGLAVDDDRDLCDEVQGEPRVESEDD
jgi:hypothetical protein